MKPQGWALGAAVALGVIALSAGGKLIESRPPDSSAWVQEQCRAEVSKKVPQAVDFDGEKVTRRNGENGTVDYVASGTFAALGDPQSASFAYRCAAQQVGGVTRIVEINGVGP